MLTKKQQLDLLTKLNDFFLKLEDESQNGEHTDYYGNQYEITKVWDRDLIDNVAYDLQNKVEAHLWNLQEEKENENNQN